MNLLATLVVVTNIGFVACYDTERNGPSWVAYDLEPDEVVRTNRVAVPFRQDPRVPRVSEESLEAAYRGYDRGHLAPAADFNWNREALRQTYYYTNVSPMSPRLNRGPWAANEAEVRRLAESGTVHVVAFPVYGSSGIPERFVKVAYGWFGVKMWDEENDPVPGWLIRRRYEVRSVSGTTWWSTDSVSEARRILLSHGIATDYLHDNRRGTDESHGSVSGREGVAADVRGERRAGEGRLGQARELGPEPGERPEGGGRRARKAHRGGQGRQTFRGYSAGAVPEGS